MIFDGTVLANEMKRGLIKEKKLVGKKLIIFQTGDKESQYVKLKRKMGESLGVNVVVNKINDIQKLKREVVRAGNDLGVDGVMVQLPIAGVSKKERDEILKLIPVNKDVDGLVPNGSVFAPAVVIAVEKILLRAQPVTQVRPVVAVIGAAGVVGRALVDRFGKKGLKVKGFDMGDDLNGLKSFDVVISATGEAGLIKKEMVKNGVIAIDLGYPKADFDEGVKEKAAFFTPVPGGVGPVTIVSLFVNLSKTN